MAISKANQRAVNKYKKNNYDRIEITVPKGQRGVFQAHAAIRSESVNGFINRAISETMDRDNAAEGSQSAAAPPTGLISPDTLETAQRAAESTGEAVPEFIHRAVLETAERDRMTKEGD